MNQTSRMSSACPFCQVAPGEPCMGANGQPRASVHIERWGHGLALKRKRAVKKVKEGNIRDLLKARVEAYGGEIRAVSWLGRSHAPDVLALFPGDSACVAYANRFDGSGRNHRGMHTFIETKRPGKDATEAQAREHTRMRDAGCDVLVITNENELNRWLPLVSSPEFK